MAIKRLDYIPGMLNAINLPVPRAFTEPITGQGIPGSGLVLGDTVRLTLKEASQLSTGPTSPGPLYEGEYQFVSLDPAATAANVGVGKVAYLVTVAKGNMVVTDGSHALSANLITGIFINAITPGNYGFIQIGGRASVFYPAAGGAAGDYTIAVAATGTGLDVTAATATVVQLAAELGYTLVPPPGVNSLGQVKLQLVNAQQ